MSSVSIWNNKDDVSDDVVSDDIVTVIRRPYINGSDPSLKKTIVTILYGNVPHNIVLVWYAFVGDEHPIIVKKHGNSKINIPYPVGKKTFKRRLKDAFSYV